MSTRAIWIGSAAAAVVTIPLLTKMWQITMARRNMSQSNIPTENQNSGTDSGMQEAQGHGDFEGA